MKRKSNNISTIPLIKTKNKNKILQKQLQNYINDQSQILDDKYSSQQPIKLKKLRKINNKQQSNQRFIKQNQQQYINKQNQQQNYLQQQQSSNQYQSYEKFQNVDDGDLKKRQEDKNKNKNKSHHKIKNGQQVIDKFIFQKKNQIKEQPIIKKTQPTLQMSLQAMFKASNKNNNIHKQISKMESQDSDDDNSSISSMEIYRKRQLAKNELKNINGGFSQQKAIQQAMKQSLKELNIKKEPNIKKDPNPKKQPEEVPSLQKYSYLNSSKFQSPKQPQKQKNQQLPQTTHRKQQKSSIHSKKSQSQKSGPFANYHILLTGEFDPYSKNRIEQILQQLGATQPKSVTNKTTHLLQGWYVKNNFNRKSDQDVTTTNKSKQAAAKGVKIVCFKSINLFFREVTGKSLDQLIQEGNKPMKQQEKNDAYIQIKKSNGEQIKAKPTSEMDEQPSKQQLNPKTPKTQNLNIPWLQKYKPTHHTQILGEQSQIKQLIQWLTKWQDIHIKGNKQQVKQNKYFTTPTGNINSNAVLVSGDPGIGKTTSVRLVAKYLGYDVVQYNASDARNKKCVEVIALGRDNLALSFQKEKINKKSLIVMDQVDGMSSGDRGGISSIIQMIKQTKIPIICICNDRHSQSIRTLAGYCYDIKFHKPNKNLIVVKLQNIIKLQGGYSSRKALEMFVQMFQNDIRQILIYLQMLFKQGIKNINSELIQRKCQQPKDTSLLLNFFQGSKRLMNRTMFTGMTISQKINLSFIDSDMMPLMIQQNYLNSCMKKKMQTRQFHQIVKATYGFSIGDVLDKLIKKQQNYSVMNQKMFLWCVYPTQMVCENLGLPKFSQWLGKFSSERKNKRLISQLKKSLNCVSFVTSHSIKHHFVRMLFLKIFEQLKTSDPSYQKIVEFMIHYDLNPAMISQHLTCLQHSSHQNLWKDKIQASKKTKLTKTYNKLSSQIKLKQPKIKKQALPPQHQRYNPLLGEMQNEYNDDEIQIEDELQKQNQGIQVQFGNKNKCSGKQSKGKKCKL